jgi:flagellar hook-associated protein 1 FlgK
VALTGTVNPGGGAPETSVSDFLHLNDFFVGTDSSGVDLGGAIQVRGDIIDTPSRLAAGALRQDSATGDYYVSAGDNAIAQKLATRFTETLTFPAAGGLAQVATTLTGYGTSILSKTSSEFAGVKDLMSAKEAVVNELRYRATSASGVNVDEELANMMVLQNAYAASARLVTIASEMLEVLNRLGQ